MIDLIRKAIGDKRQGVTSKEEALLRRDGILWLEAALRALDKASGHNAVLAQQIFEYSFKEIQQERGALPKEHNLRKEPGKVYRDIPGFGRVEL